MVVWTLLPHHAHARQSREFAVPGDDGQLLAHRLRGQRPVEGVFVAGLEPGCRERVHGRKGELEEAVLRQALVEVVV